MFRPVFPGGSKEPDYSRGLHAAPRARQKCRCVAYVVTTCSKEGEKETPLGEGWGSLPLTARQQDLPIMPHLIRTPGTEVLLPCWGGTLG